MIVVAKPRRMLGWLRTRTSSPQIGSASAAEVLDRFGMRLLGRPKNLAQSWRNPNVIVDTTAGKKLLKKYRETSNAATITHEHSIIEHLSEVDFPSVRLNHTTQGDTMVDLDGDLFAVFDFVAGRHITATYMSDNTRRALVKRAGAALGRFHIAMNGFRPAGRHHLGLDEHGVRALDLEWCLESLDRLERAGPATDPEAAESIEWLRARAGSVRESIRATTAEVDSACLPRVVIHGDYGTHNVLFRSDLTPVVHDFELSRYDWRLLDLVIAFHRMRPANRPVLLAGYRQTNDLPTGELEVLPVLWRHHLLTGAIRSWDGYLRFGGTDRLDTARSRITAAENGIPAELTSRWS